MPLEQALSHGVDHEARTKQSASSSGDHDLAGPRFGLKSCREVGSGANDRMFLSRTFADQIANDDEPGGNADPGLERLACRVSYAANCLRRGKSGTYRSLGIVLMGTRPTKIREYAVAHQLGDMPANPSDLAGDRILVTA